MKIHRYQGKEFILKFTKTLEILHQRSDTIIYFIDLFGEIFVVLPTYGWFLYVPCPESNPQPWPIGRHSKPMSWLARASCISLKGPSAAVRSETGQD